MSTRIAVDFRDEPKALAELRRRAQESKRSQAAQLLIEALPSLSISEAIRKRNQNK